MNMCDVVEKSIRFLNVYIEPLPFLSYLFSSLLRLMVNLTQPAMLCFGKVPEDPVFRHHFLQVTSHLQDYKEVILAVQCSVHVL